MTAHPQIGFLTGDPQSPNAAPHWHIFQSVEALLNAEPMDLLVLEADGPLAGQILDQLRRRAPYRFTLIFLMGEGDERARILSDGPAPRDVDMDPLWQNWRERIESFNQGQRPELFEERVMLWLWLRDQAVIEPMSDSASGQIYSYPLLRAMEDNETVNHGLWLQLMTEKSWLSAGPLEDRIRLCSDCGSGRLNYVDVCPDCRHLDIQRQPSLHCFTCGHVGGQEHFLKDDILLCPNCLTRLRHIGSDYDRPLENFRCQSCNSFFADADVEARCLDCGAHHAPSDLRVREIRRYSLTDNGRLRCRKGLDDAGADERFDRLNLVSNRHFHRLLDWELQQARRYGPPGGSLVIIRLANLSRALDRLNSVQATALVDALIERIQENIRDTDRCTRTQEELLWLLLPRTDEPGRAVLEQRLKTMTELLPQDESALLELRVDGLDLVDDNLPEEDARLLMARLASRVSR